MTVILEFLGFLLEAFGLALTSLSPSKITRKIVYNIPLNQPYGGTVQKIFFACLDLLCLIAIVGIIVYISGHVI